MSREINTKILKQVIKLLDGFSNCTDFTAQEYIDDILSQNDKAIHHHVAQIFLVIKKHETILDCILENYQSRFKMEKQEKDAVLFKVLMCVLIFELDEASFEDISDVFKKLRMSLAINTMQYMNNEEFLVIVTEISSTVFDNDYVLNVIIKPLIEKMCLVEKLQHEIIEHCCEKNKTEKKPLTKPLSPRLSQVKRRTQSVEAPVKQVEQGTTFKYKEVPLTTYHEDKFVQKKLQEACTKNRIAALKLLQRAQEDCFRVSKLSKPQCTTPVVPRVQPIKPKKIPDFKKDVNIKTNAAVLMREAALFAKNQEKEIKKLESLTSGAFDVSMFEEWEEDERKKEQQERIQEIERKHLQGLVTYEEALLAKQNLIENNKKKFLDFKAEKEKLYQMLEEWKKEQQEKMKNLVEKAQSIERNAKEAEKKITEEKYRSARMLEQETKRMLEEAMAEKQAELIRKIDLIKELRILHSVKELTRKEFDPTEIQNYGLMCEMSIAELQERLGLLKLELQEKWETKRKNVMETRQQRQELLKSAEEFVQQNRTERQSREKPKKNEKIKLQVTPEITALRDRISEIRKLRMKDFV